MGVHHPPQPAQESRVGGGQVAREELKVHIQAGVAPAQEELTELLRQPVLRGRIRQHQSGPLGVELPFSVRVDRCITDGCPAAGRR